MPESSINNKGVPPDDDTPPPFTPLNSLHYAPALASRLPRKRPNKSPLPALTSDRVDIDYVNIGESSENIVRTSLDQSFEAAAMEVNLDVGDWTIHTNEEENHGQVVTIQSLSSIYASPKRRKSNNSLQEEESLALASQTCSQQLLLKQHQERVKDGKLLANSQKESRVLTSETINRVQTPPRIQPQTLTHQIILSRSNSSTQPPTTIQKLKRHRHSSESLFSPKPIHTRPPRPEKTEDEPRTNHPSIESTTSFDSSPTPFRFNTFPASLPRVHPSPSTRLPPSPATRRLFPVPRRPVPSFDEDGSFHDQDVSGDWSEGLTFTNERMAMNVPSHFTGRFLEGGESHGETGGKLFKDFLSPPQSDERDPGERTLHPRTPRATEQFHIHNLEVSPIVRRPEDEDDGIVDRDIPMKESLDEEECFKGREDDVSSDPLLQHLFRDDSSSFHFNIDSDATSTGSATATASTATVNNATAVSNISSTTRPPPRKIRPMPDTSAFDICTPSLQSLGSKDDSGVNSHKSSASDRWMCPPTPIRTPAWAHADPARPTFQRANSLIATKVLAACPPRVLDSLSSLEDSMLENDISGSTMDHDSHPLLNSSFAPVEEKDEDGLFEGSNADACMFRPSSDNFDEQASPVKDPTRSKKANPSTKHDPEEVGTNKSRLSIGETDLSSIVSFSSDFDNLGILGSGAFADVYKVRSKRDRACYAIKRTRRQFRGVRDRERAMAEVQTMQRLQVAMESASNSTSHDRGTVAGGYKNSYGLYLLFFMRAWQEDGYFFCQTELCSRATCRQLRLSLTTDWSRDVVKYPSLAACLERGEGVDELKRLLPERTVWQVCHDISRGLFHIHSHGMVHYDIKPSNIFFVYHVRWGTMCKIGDFGLAGDIGSADDGQEGDTAYMPGELLSSCFKHPGADIFSLGLTLYEMAAAASWTLPREGERWHHLRSGSHIPELPRGRSPSLVTLIQSMLRPDAKERPSAEDVSEHADVKRASALNDSFLSRYVKDVERYDSLRERELESAEREARRRSSTPVAPILGHHGGSDPHRSWSTRTPTSDNPTSTLRW